MWAFPKEVLFCLRRMAAHIHPRQIEKQPSIPYA